MAQNVFFKKGLLANLPKTYTAGTFYVTTDERAMYLDIDDSTRIRLGDFIQVDNVAALPADAHENCLYYCVAENILAKWNGTEWTQINKQPTAEEMKALLGLGTMAYKSEVAESDLTAELAEKVNAAAEGNHAHANKGVLDGITAEKVAAWDASEQNAKDHADGLNTAMNTRVEALEAIDHEHANKALLDTYTQTEADLADAVAKKHAHTFVESELNKIVDGDVAKWNAVVADHLTADDKTTLENAIKEAKKAGTDANTNIEAYKVTNDARVLAVEEDIAEITGDNGILAQAKSYSDGKLATARTEITAEIDADVKVVADDLAGYKTTNDAALAGVKATAEAAATKAYTDEELAKKVDKVDGKSLIADTEITRLAGMSDGANKVEASETNGNIKIDGVETVVYTHPDKHAIADVDGLQDAIDAVDAKFADYNTTAAQKVLDDAQDARIKAIEDDYLVEADIANFETKDNVKKVADDLAAYVESNDAALAAETKARTDADADFETRIAALEGNFGDGEGTVEAQIEAAVAAETEAREAAVQGVQDDVDALAGKVGEVPEDKTVVQMIADAQTAATYDDTQVKADIKANADAIDAIEADYLKAADKTELQEQITANANAITLLTDGADPDKVDGVKDLIDYVDKHGPEVTGMKADIAANAKAIEDHETLAAETYETKTDATAKLTEAKGYADDKAAEAQAAAEATAAGALAGAKTELEGKITDGDAATLASAKEYADGKVNELAGGQVKANAEAIVANAKAITDGDAAVEAKITALAEGAVATNAANIAALTNQLTWGDFV